MSGSLPGRIGRVTLKRQVASLGSDPTRLLYAGRLTPTDEVLARKGGVSAYPTYEELERDPKVGFALAKRKAALVGREWSIVTPDDKSAAATDAADLVTRALNGLPFNQIVENMLAALLLGVSFHEVLWVVKGNELLPGRINHCNPRRFSQKVISPDESPDDTDSIELRILTRGNMLDGEPVPARKFIAHRHGVRYEDPWGLGLGNRLWWPVFFKRQGIGFWMGALEKFGQPTVIGKYPAGTTEAMKVMLLEAVGAVSTDAGVAFPAGMEIELLEASRAGNFDSYRTLAAYMDEDIILTILGETLTSTAGSSGSRALGEVHNEVRLELTKADADKLSDTLNRTLIPWIIELNRPGYAGVMPQIWWDCSEPEDLAARAKRDIDIASLGFEPTDEYVAETYGKGWRRVERKPPPATQPPGMLPGAPGAAFAQAHDPRDAVDLLAEQLGLASAPLLDQGIGKVRELLARATSAEDFLAGLPGVLMEMPNAELGALIGDALTASRLSGAADQLDGA